MQSASIGTSPEIVIFTEPTRIEFRFTIIVAAFGVHIIHVLFLVTHSSFSGAHVDCVKSGFRDCKIETETNNPPPSLSKEIFEYV